MKRDFVLMWWISKVFGVRSRIGVFGYLPQKYEWHRRLFFAEGADQIQNCSGSSIWIRKNKQTATKQQQQQQQKSET